MREFAANRVRPRAGTGPAAMYPSGDIHRYSQWKQWALPEAVQAELDILSAYWKKQGNKAELAGRPQTMVEAMVRYDFNPSERHQVLFNVSASEVEIRFIEIIRLKRSLCSKCNWNIAASFPIKALFL